MKDYSTIAKSVSKTIAHASRKPLTDDQEMALAGALAVWLSGAYDEGRADQAKLETEARARFIAELRATKDKEPS